MKALFARNNALVGLLLFAGLAGCNQLASHDGELVTSKTSQNQAIMGPRLIDARDSHAEEIRSPFGIAGTVGVLGVWLERGNTIIVRNRCSGTLIARDLVILGQGCLVEADSAGNWIWLRPEDLRFRFDRKWFRNDGSTNDGRSQAVDATNVLNTSPGVLQSSVCLGRPFS